MGKSYPKPDEVWIPLASQGGPICSHRISYLFPESLERDVLTERSSSKEVLVNSNLDVSRSDSWCESTSRLALKLPPRPVPYGLPQNMQPPILPLELYRDIFKHLDGHLSTLRSLTLVSRACHAEATPFLYHTLDTNNHTTQRLFLRSLLIDPNRAKWVRRWKFRTCERIGTRNTATGQGDGGGAGQTAQVRSVPGKLASRTFESRDRILDNYDAGTDADIIHLLRNALPLMCNLKELSIRLGQNFSDDDHTPHESATIIYPSSPGTHLAAVLPRCTFQLRVFEWDVPSADPHKDESSLLTFLVRRWELHRQMERLRIMWEDTMIDGWWALPGIGRVTPNPDGATAAEAASSATPDAGILNDGPPLHRRATSSVPDGPGGVAFPALKVFAGSLKSIVAFLPLLRARRVQSIIWIASEPESFAIQRHDTSSLVPFLQASHVNGAWDVTHLYTNRRSDVATQDPAAFWRFFGSSSNPSPLRDILSATAPLLSFVNNLTHLSLDGTDRRLGLGMLASGLGQIEALELMGYFQDELEHIKGLPKLATILFSLPSLFSSQSDSLVTNFPLPPRATEEQSALVRRLFQANNALETVNIQIKFTVSPTGWYKQWKRLEHELGHSDDEPTIVERKELSWWYD